MAKKEVKTDLWVYDLLKDAGIKASAQGSDTKEINDALKTASKKGTGNAGYPEYVAVVNNNYVIVIEDKADIQKHEKRDEKNLISEKTEDVINYAINGALFYAKHIIKNTNYKEVFAIGVSGNEKMHKITPIFVNETTDYKELEEVESFISFNSENIEEYYNRIVLKQDTNIEKELSEIREEARSLHEDLWKYGHLKETEKPLVVSGILLALDEGKIDKDSFSISQLTGDNINTDGMKIYNAIENHLKRVNVSPDVKRNTVLNEFAFIKTSTILNEYNSRLGKTPLKYFTEFLDLNIYKCIKFSNSSEDYLGEFYSEFVKYSGGDGQALGIVLTPKHITELFCDIVNLKKDDIVLDPCCGTGGFLIAAMHRMFKLADNEEVIENIKQKQLQGIELQSNMYTIATTNMILRGDGKSNLMNDDFLSQSAPKLQLKGATVGMMNPPYSQGTKETPGLYELSFVEHLLDSLIVGSRCAVIIPQSSVTGKTSIEQNLKKNILKKHTLEGVITLNKDTFYGIGVMPCIAVFTAGKMHKENHICKFINFEDDGFKIAPHIGLVETGLAKDRKQHLLDVWFDRIEDENKFCVKTTIEDTDEWLHSFYYFNDELPTEEDFNNSIADYITFEINSITHKRGYLFEEEKSNG